MLETKSAGKHFLIVLTPKVISPNSQEKLCEAMKSIELPDDMDLFKWKEKLCFGEPAENTFSSTKSDRQMQDIEFLASKLISELNSVRVIAEEKMLYEAYRSPSVKDEVD
ncbi:hypothetical protein Tco_1367726 [Tanacetum coccineum]